MIVLFLAFSLSLRNRKLRQTINGDTACGICLNTAIGITDMSDEDFTLAEMKTLTLQSCSLYDKEYKPSCELLAKDYVPLILKLIELKQNETQICTKLGYCSYS